MKNRRGDKHYEPRHGGTRTDNLRETAARAGSAVPIATGIVVSLVTGALFRDDVIRAAHRVLGDRPAHLVPAGWAFVAIVFEVPRHLRIWGALAIAVVSIVSVITAAALAH